jgi:hypothetical protein
MTKERNMATFKVGDRVRLMAGRTGTVTAVHAEHDRCHVKAWSDHHRRDVEYLVPDEQLTLADAPAPTGPRYVVRAASEMREGEPYVNAWHGKSLDFETADAARRFAVRANADVMSPSFVWPSQWPDAVVAVIDTHDTWHLASGAAMPPPAPVEPPRPSDAEVCAKYAEMQRDDKGWNRDRLTVFHDGTYSQPTMAEVRAAWSRELRRLAAASAETERMRVVVQCQDGGADDV